MDGQFEIVIYRLAGRRSEPIPGDFDSGNGVAAYAPGLSGSRAWKKTMASGSIWSGGRQLTTLAAASAFIVPAARRSWMSSSRKA